MDGFVIIWQYWAILALLFVVVEVFTISFTFLSFAFGAIGAAIASGIGMSFEMQLLVFSVLTVLSFVFVRPLALRMTQKSEVELKTNVHAMVGRRGVVEDDFTELGGRVLIDGDNWKAVSEDGSLLKKGDVVEILEINSIIITVKKV
jgi:membrane protein implicated in regulation of membrane protease activity